MRDERQLAGLPQHVLWPFAGDGPDDQALVLLQHVGRVQAEEHPVPKSHSATIFDWLEREGEGDGLGGVFAGDGGVVEDAVAAGVHVCERGQVEDVVVDDAHQVALLVMLRSSSTRDLSLSKEGDGPGPLGPE